MVFMQMDITTRGGGGRSFTIATRSLLGATASTLHQLTGGLDNSARGIKGSKVKSQKFRALLHIKGGGGSGWPVDCGHDRY